MIEQNGTKYITVRLFCWIIGVLIALFLASYAYLNTSVGGVVQQVQANTITLTRLETRLDGILETVIEIKDIIKN